MSGRPGVSWKIHRLRSMTPAEIIARISDELSSRFERRAVTRHKYDGSLESWVRVPSVSAIRPVLFTDGHRTRIAEAYRNDPSKFSEDISLATSVLNGDVPFFGARLMQVGNSPRWHTDPFSGREWALDYWRNLLPGGKEMESEPRSMWELHRCHHVVYLAKGYAASQREDFADAVVRQMDDWHLKNPYLTGIGWAGGLECSIRAVNWMVALELIKGSKTYAGLGTETISRWLYGQANFARRHLSTYASSRNNHLIGEAAGLFLVGLALSESREGMALSKLGQRLLESEIERQVHDDGFDKELCTSYQRFVAQFFMVCLRAAENNSVEFSSTYRTRLERMLGVLRYLVEAFGELPHLGDNDEGVFLPLGRGSDQIRWMIDLPGTETTGNRVSDPPGSAWFLPPIMNPMDEVSDEEVSVGFEKAGYFVSRGEGPGPRYSAVIDCGELGYLSLAAHGHADCLSLTMSIDGIPFVVDPGTFCYHTRRKWREYFRSTRAHSTIEVDGKSQSESRGPFIWGERARPRVHQWNRGTFADWFSGGHDGYRHSGIMHSRNVLSVKGSYVIMVDHVEGKGFHQVCSSLHLAPGELLISGSCATYSSDSETGSCSGTLHWFGPEGTEAVSLKGADTDGGWVSKEFLEKEVSPTLRLRSKIELPAMVVLVLIPGTAYTSRPVLSVESEHPGEHVCFSVCSDDWSDFCCVGSGGNEDYRLTGEIAVLRRRKGKSIFIGADVKEFKSQSTVVEGGGAGGLLEMILEEP